MYNKMVDIYLSTKIEKYWLSDNSYYSIKSKDKFTRLFFSFFNNTIHIQSPNKDNNNNPNTIVCNIYDIQETSIDTSKNRFNIMLCVENCNAYNHFQHYNKYGSYGNENVLIYIYNHIDKFVKTSNYVAIPVMYLQIDYFQKYQECIQPAIITPFKDKKFCLIVSFSRFPNQDNKINKMVDTIKQMGECHSIKDFYHMKNISCYHDVQLLNLFNEYKFVLCFENSFNNGYITEKIFNCFFAKTIPLYFGPSDKYRYFNKNALIDLDNNVKLTTDLIRLLNANENIYGNFVSNAKINKQFDNEDYSKKTKQFIQEKLL
jgi:hypothetical protein